MIGGKCKENIVDYFIGKFDSCPGIPKFA